MCYFKKYYTIHPIIIDKSMHLPSKSTYHPPKNTLNWYVFRQKVCDTFACIFAYICVFT